MADIGYITDIPHLILKMCKITVQQVEGYCRAGMAEVGIAVNGRTANIQADKWCMKRFEELFLFRQAVKNE